MQEQDLETAIGFILGADGDTEASRDAHIEFIQTTGIVMAMVSVSLPIPSQARAGKSGGWRSSRAVARLGLLWNQLKIPLKSISYALSSVKPVPISGDAS